MKLISYLLIAGYFAAAINLSRAQETHQHKHEPSEQLGQVNFVVSCNSKAQKQFNRAVAWLHSFEYEESARAFTEIATTDPKCGMAYWGVAMSSYHPLWSPPSAEELKSGLAAAEKATEVSAQTQRERDYIAAIGTFYKDADKIDHRTRTFAYHEAMKKIYEQNPSDHEAAVFYALTLIDTGTYLRDKNYANEKEAARILNTVLTSEPKHPGVSHYLIHSYDYPALAKLALPAARSYAKIAPSSAHAQHMPSHIFTRLGLWQEAIQSNLDARASAKAFAARHHMVGAWDEQIHAMDYLAYAYLQGAQDKAALGVLNELNQIRQVDPPSFKVAYAFAAIPARYALERRQWSEAAKLSLQPGGMKNFPWQNFRWAEADIHFARAVGAARTGDTAAAGREVEQLKTIRAELSGISGYDWSKQVDVQQGVASAWLAYAEGKHEEALKLMRAAADLDDATEKHPVTPGSILPAREQLGELLLEMQQGVAGLKEFEASLINTPNRFNGLYGAARAAQLAADQAKAKTYYQTLLEVCRHSDSSRPELEQARKFLGRS